MEEAAEGEKGPNHKSLQEKQKVVLSLSSWSKKDSPPGIMVYLKAQWE